MDDGTSLTGFKAIKFSKNLYNCFEPGQAVYCIKDPRSSTGGFIFGGRETGKDNPPIINDISDFVVSNKFGEISIKEPESGGISIMQDDCGLKFNSKDEESSQMYFADNQIFFYNSSDLVILEKLK